MATINTKKRKNGQTSFQILFFLNKKRKTLSLGSQYTRKQAERIKSAVEEIADAIETGGKVGKSTAGFIADMTDDLKARFITCGLLEESESVTFKELFKRFFESESGSLKQSTITTYEQAQKRLFDFFDKETKPDELTKKDGEAWKLWQKERYSPATICGSFQRLAHVLNWGVENGLIEANPFKGIKRGSFVNPNRLFYVPMDWYHKLLEACPCQTWRTLLALCRIGGLRNPSETLLLKWEDVDFDNKRILVHSPKTEHIEGKETRLLYMFPLLERELLRQSEAYTVGDSPYVIAKYRDTAANMRTQFRRIIFRAGLPEWERTFQNLRASASTDIEAEFGAAAESVWVGHSTRMALKHYLQISDNVLERAAHWNAEKAQKSVAASETTTQTTTTASEIGRFVVEST